MDEHPAEIELWAFRFPDPLTGRWIRARYVATLEDIRARYDRFELIGEPERRTVISGSFSPHRREPG